MTWYHADLSKTHFDEWMSYISELDRFVFGVDRQSAQEEARRIIVETTGDNDPQIVWNEC